jgi:hypothetical protein
MMAPQFTAPAIDSAAAANPTCIHCLLDSTFFLPLIKVALSEQNVAAVQ